MAPAEHARVVLYGWMQDTADRQKAEALMASLPPTDWPDLATKHDIELLKKDLEALEHKLLAVFRAELTSAVTTAITSQTRSITFQVVGLFVAFATLTWMVR